MEEIVISVYKKCGIYGIRNKLNNKIYIGKTIVNFGDRWDCHRSQLRGNYHGNPHLQNAWNKYGEENFEFVIIEECDNEITLEELNKLEIKYIKEAKETGLCYNISDGGDDGQLAGKHLSEETKRKIGEANRINMTGRKASEKTKAKMAVSQKKRWEKLTPDEKQKTIDTLNSGVRGIKWSEERRKKYSEQQSKNPHGAKYDVETVREIRRLYEKENMSITDISNKLNIKRYTVYLIATYRRWKNIV